MDNKKNGIPKLRFPGFTGAWEQRKLVSLFSKFTDGDWIESKDQANTGIRLIQTGNIGITEFINKFGNEKWISEETFKKLNCEEIFPGDIIISRLPDPAGRACILPKLDTRMITAVDCTIARTSREASAEFIVQYLSTQTYFKYVQSCLAGGTRQRISRKNLANFNVSIPTEISEQKQIGFFFKQLDTLIALHQRKLEHLQEQKKGLLQKMFPKNGETVPEVRFPGFTDAWEQRKLSSMTQYKNGKGHEDKQTDSGDFELVNLNSISIDGGFKHSGKFINESDDGILYKNDLVMILSDVGHGDLLGRVALIPDDNKFILNQRVALLRPNKTANPEFLFFYINSHQKYFKSQGAGMSQLNISKKSVETFSSLVPNIDEQKKISLFFKQLDSLITLHQRKLDHLELMKKGLLQQMFV